MNVYKKGFFSRKASQCCSYLLCIVCLFVTLKSTAQGEEEKVKETISRLFDGMRKADSTLIRSAFSPDAILQTVAKNKEGAIVVRSDKVDEFIAAVSKPHKEVYDERITFDLIRIDSDLAVAWTPYKFYLDNKFSHCGVNSFQLVRLDGAWKIQYIIDTRRKENCE